MIRSTDGKNTTIFNCNLDFLASLLRRFDEMRISFDSNLRRYSFGKAVRKTYYISQPKYVSHAIKYFPKPYTSDAPYYSEECYKVYRIMQHFRDHGVRKLLSGLCVYVADKGDGQRVYSSVDPDYCIKHHEKKFRETFLLVSSLIQECGISCTVNQYFKSVGLLGGTKAFALWIPLTGVVGRAINFEASTNLAIGNNYQPEYYPVMFKHFFHSYFKVIEVKVFVATEVLEETEYPKQYVIVVYDDAKQKILSLKTIKINGPKYSCGTVLRFHKYENESSGSRLHCTVMCQDFPGVIRVEFMHRVAFSESPFFPEEDFEFKPFNCVCETCTSAYPHGNKRDFIAMVDSFKDKLLILNPIQMHVTGKDLTKKDRMIDCTCLNGKRGIENFVRVGLFVDCVIHSYQYKTVQQVIYKAYVYDMYGSTFFSGCLESILRYSQDKDEEMRVFDVFFDIGFDAKIIRSESEGILMKIPYDGDSDENF